MITGSAHRRHSDPRYIVRPQISDSNRSTTGTKDVTQQGLADACAGVRGSTPSAASGGAWLAGILHGASPTAWALVEGKRGSAQAVASSPPARPCRPGSVIPLRRALTASRQALGLLSIGQLLSSVAMRPSPPPSPGEEPKTEEAFAAHSGLVPTPRAAETEHPQRARAAAERRMWTALPTVAVTTAEHRTLTNFCAQAAADVGPPAVDSSEVLRALVRAMRGSAELRSWVRDELARSRSAPEPRRGPGDAAGPRSIELNSMDGRSASTPGPVVVLSRRGRHRAPPGH
jgi:hypothetical protein